LNLIFDMF